MKNWDHTNTVQYTNTINDCWVINFSQRENIVLKYSLRLFITGYEGRFKNIYIVFILQVKIRQKDLQKVLRKLERKPKLWQSLEFNPHLLQERVELQLWYVQLLIKITTNTCSPRVWHRLWMFIVIAFKWLSQELVIRGQVACQLSQQNLTQLCGTSSLGHPMYIHQFNQSLWFPYMPINPQLKHNWGVSL